VCWSTKAVISLKRVKIDEKLLWTAYKNSLTLFRTVPSPTPYGLLFPEIGGSQPRPKLQSLLSQERVKLWTSNLASTFTGSIGSIRTKPIKNLGEMAAWAYPGAAQFRGYPLLSQERVKLRTSNFVFCTLVHRIERNKSPLKISGKVAVGVVRNSRKFSCHPYIGASRGHLCDSSAFLCRKFIHMPNESGCCCSSKKLSQPAASTLFGIINPARPPPIVQRPVMDQSRTWRCTCPVQHYPYRDTACTATRAGALVKCSDNSEQCINCQRQNCQEWKFYYSR